MLFADEVFGLGTLPDGTLAGTRKKGPRVNMISFKSRRIRAHAPVALGDPNHN